MLSVFVCEDQSDQLDAITTHIKNYVSIESLAMEVVCSTTSPHDILDYISNNQVAGLYFLDVDLQCDMDGIQLAKAIRKHDPRGFIVFITADAESLTLTFKYMVEAMDYIVKGDTLIKDRICKCIHDAYAKYTAKPSPLQDTFVYRLSSDTNKLSKGSPVAVERSNILYFEVNQDRPHNLIIYTENGKYDFRYKLSQVQKELDERFFKCHRAFIANMTKVNEFDVKNLKLIFANGDKIDVAAKHAKKVKSMIGKWQEITNEN